MIKYLIGIFSLFWVFSLSAQDQSIVLQSFVKEDTVQLRWATSTPESFIRGLEEGYVIERKSESGTIRTFEIPPFEERKEKLFQHPDSQVVFLTSFVEQFLNEKDQNDPQGPFFLLSLSASTSNDIAQILGYYLVDPAVNNQTYRYSIRIGNDSVIADEITVNAGQLSKNVVCTPLKAINHLKRKEVYLTWEAKTLVKDYGGYWLQRKTDTTDFKNLNETPLFYLTSQYEREKTIIDFLDTAVVEGQTYTYRVLPINHFGDLGSPSEEVSVYIGKRLSGSCRIDTVKGQGLERIIEATYFQPNEPDEVAKWVLYRSDSVHQGYQFIKEIPYQTETVSFNYTAKIITGDRHYFKLATVSPDSDTAWSFPYYYFTLDQEPPALPTEFKGIINDKGVATLTWTPPSDNDLQGYRIFRANSLKEEFVEITTQLSTIPSYHDTLALDNLTSEVYYAIRAVDLNFNNSPTSDPILLMKPDTIPPVASVFRKYKVQPEGIYLEWVNSNSEDLQNQILLRSDGIKNDTILQFKEQFNSFVDSSCVPGKRYTYQLIALDEVQNSRSCEPISLVFEPGFRPAPSNLAGKVDRTNKKIDLTWENNTLEPIYAIRIYRAKNDGPFKLIETLHESVQAFEDNHISPNNMYQYKVKITYKSGKSSKMSESVLFNY